MLEFFNPSGHQQNGDHECNYRKYDQADLEAGGGHLVMVACIRGYLSSVQYDGRVGDEAQPGQSGPHDDEASGLGDDDDQQEQHHADGDYEPAADEHFGQSLVQGVGYLLQHTQLYEIEGAYDRA